MAKQLKLHNVWKAKNAEFYEDYGYELPHSFGSSKKEYESLKTNAGLVDFSARGKIKVTGSDRIDVLHRILTQDIKAISVGSCGYSAFLTSKGKVVADMYVYVFEDFVLLDTEMGLAGKLIEGLNKLIIIEDIQLEDVTDKYCHLAIIGNTEDLKLDLLSQAGWKEFRFNGFLLAHNYRDKLFHEFLIPADQAEACVLYLSDELGIQSIGYEAYEAWRIKLDVLRYGKDITEEYSLPETLLDDIAASDTKGCYPGQEVVARTNTYKGHTKKCISLKFDGDKKPGDTLMLDGKDAGELTSTSKLNGQAIGYIRKDFFDLAENFF